jgi:ABC-type transport system substrate-binding protein
MQTNTPDGAHPDMWARIEWYSTGGLNYLGYKDPQADKALDQALETTDKAAADQLYGEAGRSSPRTRPSSSSPTPVTSWCCART